MLSLHFPFEFCINCSAIAYVTFGVSNTIEATRGKTKNLNHYQFQVDLYPDIESQNFKCRDISKNEANSSNQNISFTITKTA